MRVLIPFAIFLAAISHSWAADVSQNTLEAAAKPQENSAQRRTCAFPDLNFTSDVAVYAAGAHLGRRLSFQIDQSGNNATQIDVAVNSPTRPVVLMLGAYQPTIWNISWTQKTNILAVLAGGHHRQAVAGLDKTTPVLASSLDNRAPCGEFHYYLANPKPDLDRANRTANRVFGHSIDMFFPAQNGSVVIGDPLLPEAKLVTSSDITPESFYDKSAPLAGPAGISDAVSKGFLRKATAVDAQAWCDTVLKDSPHRDTAPVACQGMPRPQPRIPIGDAYVVLKPFVYPSGLSGAHSVTFLIPKGVPRPEGKLGHSSAFDFNTLSCTGGWCRMY